MLKDASTEDTKNTNSTTSKCQTKSQTFWSLLICSFVQKTFPNGTSILIHHTCVVYCLDHCIVDVPRHLHPSARDLVADHVYVYASDLPWILLSRFYFVMRLDRNTDHMHLPYIMAENINWFFNWENLYSPNLNLSWYTNSYNESIQLSVREPFNINYYEWKCDSARRKWSSR